MLVMREERTLRHVVRRASIVVSLTLGGTTAPTVFSSGAHEWGRTHACRNRALWQIQYRSVLRCGICEVTKSTRWSNPVSSSSCNSSKLRDHSTEEWKVRGKKGGQDRRMERKGEKGGQGKGRAREMCL